MSTKKNKEANLHIRLTELQKKKLDNLAKENGLKISAYVLKAVFSSRGNVIDIETCVGYVKMSECFNKIYCLAQKNPEGDFEKQILSMLKEANV